jgi:hypothetical protein
LAYPKAKIQQMHPGLIDIQNDLGLYRRVDQSVKVLQHIDDLEEIHLPNRAHQSLKGLK